MNHVEVTKNKKPLRKKFNISSYFLFLLYYKTLANLLPFLDILLYLLYHYYTKKREEVLEERKEKFVKDVLDNEFDDMLQQLMEERMERKRKRESDMKM